VSSLSPRRVTPWSKKTDELVRYVAARVRPSLFLELGHWIDDNPHFADFVAANRDKIRKKLNTASTDDTRLDVRAELLVARLVLADRRFDLRFEIYGSRQSGPDLSVTYRKNQRFNLEVTRLRTPPEADTGRLAGVVAAKVRQLPGDVGNALVIVAPALNVDIGDALRLLKQRTETRDDAFFVARGFRNARDFYAHYLRLAGVLVVDEASDPPRVAYVQNREARRPLPDEAIGRLSATDAAS
jgi:hypothetical protein